MFDAPYVEIEPEAQRQVPENEELVELEPGDLHELIAHGQEKQHAKAYLDLWERIRAGFSVQDMDKDPQVIRVAKRFANDRFLERTAQRAAGLLFYVVEETDRRGLPMEVVLVPFVESGYTLEATSHAAAHGAWQFIENTARTYELGIDRFRDERRSLVNSTRAAHDYLSMLYGMFDSWPLAMAAYNCGEKRIQAEVDRAKARGIKNPTFKDLAPRLPQETRDYVPRIFALKKIVADPKAYKAALPSIENAPQHSVIEIHRDIDISLVAKLAGMSVTELQTLNPSLRSPVIVGASHTQLLLPHSAALRLSLNMGLHSGPWVSWRMVRVTRPTMPGELARRNNVPVRQILWANPLPEGHYYAVGSTLLLPIKENERDEVAPIDAEMAQSAVLMTRQARPPNQFVTH